MRITSKVVEVVDKLPQVVSEVECKDNAEYADVEAFSIIVSAIRFLETRKEYDIEVIIGTVLKLIYEKQDNIVEFNGGNQKWQ